MKTAKSDRSDRNRKAIAGLRKHYASTPTMIFNGVSQATADVITGLQASIDAADATAAAAATFHKAVDAEKTANARGDAVYGGLKTFVTTQLKTSPDSMADFGFALPSRRTPDAATKADAVDKRSATRAARHTMGKRQKAKVTGAPAATAASATGQPATGAAGATASAGPAPAGTAQPPSVPATK
jgi:hypothetical protein